MNSGMLRAYRREIITSVSVRINRAGKFSTNDRSLVCEPIYVIQTTCRLVRCTINKYSIKDRSNMAESSVHFYGCHSSTEN